MTEKDLMEYITLGKRIARLSLLYEEEGRKISSPRSPNLTGMPRNTGDGDEKLLKALDTRSFLLSEINRLLEQQQKAYKRLEAVWNRLNDDTREDVFICLYHKGFNINETAAALKYSASSIYRTRREIWSIAERVEA